MVLQSDNPTDFSVFHSRLQIQMESISIWPDSCFKSWARIKIELGAVKYLCFIRKHSLLVVIQVQMNLFIELHWMFTKLCHRSISTLHRGWVIWGHGGSTATVAQKIGLYFDCVFCMNLWHYISVDQYDREAIHSCTSILCSHFGLLLATLLVALHFTPLAQGLQAWYKGCFLFIGTPPKSSKYKKVNLG